MLLSTQVTKSVGSCSFSFKSAHSLIINKLSPAITGKRACQEKFTIEKKYFTAVFCLYSKNIGYIRMNRSLKGNAKRYQYFRKRNVRFLSFRVKVFNAVFFIFLFPQP